MRAIAILADIKLLNLLLNLIITVKKAQLSLLLVIIYSTTYLDPVYFLNYDRSAIPRTTFTARRL